MPVCCCMEPCASAHSGCHCFVTNENSNLQFCELHVCYCMYWHSDHILFCRMSSSFLVSGGRDLTIKLWSLPQENPSSIDTVLPLQSKLTQKAHDKEIQSIAVSPNDKLIASGSRDKKAKVASFCVLCTR